MNKKPWFPIKIGDKIEWYQNWDLEFPGFAPDFKFTPEEIVNNANDVAWAIWGYRNAMHTEDRYHQMVSIKEEIIDGDSSMDVIVSPHVSFPSPASLIKQGAERRIKERVQIIKADKAKYTNDIGTALRIIGADDPFNPDTITAVIRSIMALDDKIIINFLKKQTDGAVLYCKRGDGDFEKVGIFNYVPAEDTRVNLEAGPEKRIYKIKHIYKNKEVGHFSTKWTITADIH